MKLGALNCPDDCTVLITPLANYAVLEVVVSAGHCTIDILKEEKKPILFGKPFGKKLIYHILSRFPLNRGHACGAGV